MTAAEKRRIEREALAWAKREGRTRKEAREVARGLVRVLDRLNRLRGALAQIRGELRAVS